MRSSGQGLGPKQSVVENLLQERGVTFAEELKIKLERHPPSELFKLLCASLLFSTRIGHQLALRATTALFRKGWTNPKRMAEAGWLRINSA